METQKENMNEDNYNSLKNVILIILILIFAYLIEKSFPSSFLKNIYFFLTFIIILCFILKNLCDSKFNSIIEQIKQKIPFFHTEEKINKENKKKLDKIKNIYEYGYLYNKNNDNKPKYIDQNQYYNLSQTNNYFNNNKNKNIKNDEILAKKILNINKINKPSLMDSFDKDKFYNYNTNNDNNFYYNNNNINNNNYNINNITNLPGSDDKDPNNYIERKNLISSPFNAKIKTTRYTPNYSDSSGNFSLFSNNKNKIKNQNIINNNIIDTNPINRFKINDLDTDYQITSNFSYNTINKIPKDKQVSYNKYRLLKQRNDNTQALNQNYNTFDYNKDIDKIPKELININYNNWMIKLRMFISNNLIPNLLSKHDNNISNLNNILSLLGIKIISTSPEDESNDYINIINKKLSLVNSNRLEIKQNNEFLYQNLKNNINNNFNNNFMNFKNNINENKNIIFPSLNTFNDFINDTKEISDIKNNDENLKSIFFGDTNKFKQILQLVENKINSIDLEKNNDIKHTSYYQRQMIVKTLILNNNPFLKKEHTKTIDEYLRNINDNNNCTLTNLQRLLYERIIINERLYPKELFEKKNENHALLVMEYAIERFRQLQENFEYYGNGAKGGEFLNENWCSLLPTDSQLIAHLIINYIESIYLINNNNDNQQKFLISYPMNYTFPINENNNNVMNQMHQTQIFLYQINPSTTEPMFNVVYKNVLIPSILGSMNLFHAFSIYFYLLSIKSQMFVMSLGIHDFINNITK